MKGETLTQDVLLGVRAASIEQTVKSITSRLGCTFQKRESDYLGTYWLALVDDTEIRVVSQPDPEGEPLEDDFPDYKTLVYVEGEGEALDLEGIVVASERLTTLSDS